MNEPPPSPPTTGPSQASNPICVAIVEDNPDDRELFRRSVERSPDLSCVGTFITGEEALRVLPSLLPDLVLMDIHLPGINGIECMNRLRKILAEVKVVVVTSERDDDYLFEALRNGADGYVTKPCDRHTLARVIRNAMAGLHPISPDMTGVLVQAAINPPKPRLQPHPSLTTRENEVLRGLVEGRENKEIAEWLNLSVTTVNSHVQSIFGKFGVQNRVEAVRVAMGL
jgi:two-component system, NarL family, response regulator LiaR